MPLSDLHACVVSIHHSRQTEHIVGTGFIVDNHHILTCAHVINNAGVEPGQDILVKFIDNELQEAHVLSEYFRNSDKEDLAVLRLYDQKPATTVPPPLGSHHHETRPFKTCGYHALSHDLQLSFAEGQIHGAIPHNGNFQVLQLTAPQKDIKGMSGAPIIDLISGVVVGMIQHQHKGNDTKLALPITEIKRICPDFGWSESPPVKLLMPTLQKVDSGVFQMGSAKNAPHARPNETPQHERHVDTYFLSKYPVTNAEYARFVTAAPHTAPDHWSDNEPPAEKPDHPVVHVSYHDAQAYCQWLSQTTGHPFRLPTEAEWEKAARGTSDARIYCWGNKWQKFRCNSNEDDLEDTTHVFRYEKLQKNPYGVADMLGNVWEWTASEYEPYPGSDHITLMQTGVMYVVRGGSFLHDGPACRIAVRGRYAPKDKKRYLGFRIATSNQPPPVQQQVGKADISPVSFNPKRKRQLRKAIESSFGLTDLSLLVSDLGLDKDNFTQKKSIMIQELLEECERRNLINQLLQLLRKERPHVNWDQE